MGLDFNKVFMAVCAVALFFMVVLELSGFVYGSGGHHGHDDHHPETKTEWAKTNFPGYWEDIAEVRTAVDVIEEIFDWGLALRNADLARGERTFKSACSSCHTIVEGGANGTGPNLYAIVGENLAARAGFGYSAALTAVGGQWDYDQMNVWLNNPARFARGTSMSYRGVRNDTDRANLVAYLASVSPDAPEFPEPLSAPEAEVVEVTLEGDAVVGEAIDAALTDGDSPTVDALVEGVVSDVEAQIDQ